MTVSACPAQSILIMDARGFMGYRDYSSNFLASLSLFGIAARPQEDELCPIECEINCER